MGGSRAVESMGRFSGQRDSRSWFFARLFYLTAVRRSGQRVVIEEDLWLIAAESEETARRELVAGGQGAARVGRALADRHAREPGRIDLRWFDELFGADGRTGAGTDDFLGLKGLHRVGKRLVSGTVADCVEFDTPPGGSTRFPNVRSLMAFDPAGPAYSGAGRRRENEYLLGRYQWYLAEQWFTVLRAESEATGQRIRPSARFVLIRAGTPEEAYQKSIANGEGHRLAPGVPGAGRKVFQGLRELSLISDRFRCTCALRTNEHFVDAKNLAQFLAQGS